MNINDQIECRLTVYGREALARYYTELFSDHLCGDPDYTLADRIADVNTALASHDAGHLTYRFALWEFAHIFGPKFIMGGRQIVEGNEISVVG